METFFDDSKSYLNSINIMLIYFKSKHLSDLYLKFIYSYIDNIRVIQIFYVFTLSLLSLLISFCYEITNKTNESLIFTKVLSILFFILSLILLIITKKTSFLFKFYKKNKPVAIKYLLIINKTLCYIVETYFILIVYIYFILTDKIGSSIILIYFAMILLNYILTKRNIEFRYNLISLVLKLSFALTLLRVISSEFNFDISKDFLIESLVLIIISTSIIEAILVYRIDFLNKHNFLIKFDQEQKKDILKSTILNLNFGVMLVNSDSQIIFMNKFIESNCNILTFNKRNIIEEKLEENNKEDDDNSNNIIVFEKKNTENSPSIILKQRNDSFISSKIEINKANHKNVNNITVDKRNYGTSDDKRYPSLSLFQNEANKKSNFQNISNNIDLSINNDFFSNFIEVNNTLPVEIINSINNKELNTIQSILKNKNIFEDNNKTLGIIKITSEEKSLFYEVFIKIITNYGIENPIIEFVIQDITKFKQYEFEKSLIKSKTTFMAKIAHEFKNPLICIGELTEDIREKLTNLQKDPKGNAKDHINLIENPFFNLVKPKRSKSCQKIRNDFKSSAVSQMKRKTYNYSSSRNLCNLANMVKFQKPAKFQTSKTLSVYDSSVNTEIGFNSEYLNKIKVDLMTVKSLSSYIISLVFDFEVLAKKEASSEIISIPSKFNLKKEIEFLHELSVVLIKKTSLTVKFILELDPNLPKQITTDSLRLRQILINLISNSIKFTPFGHIKQKVSKGMNNILEFSVEDTGTGIHNSNLIFNTSFKSIGENNSYGTGLGLMIVKDLSKCIGGEIRYKKNIPKGSCFIVSVPYESEKIEDQSTITVKNEAIKLKPKLKRSSQCNYFSNSSLNSQIDISIKAIVSKYDNEVKSLEDEKVLFRTKRSKSLYISKSSNSMINQYNSESDKSSSYDSDISTKRTNFDNDINKNDLLKLIKPNETNQKENDKIIIKMKSSKLKSNLTNQSLNKIIECKEFSTPKHKNIQQSNKKSSIKKKNGEKRTTISKLTFKVESVSKKDKNNQNSKKKSKNSRPKSFSRSFIKSDMSLIKEINDKNIQDLSRNLVAPEISNITNKENSISSIMSNILIKKIRIDISCDNDAFDSKCILVVDDERIIRQSTIKLLEKYFRETVKNKTELTIIEASDGIEALYAIYWAIHNNVDISFILTDDYMKYMCGSELVNILQNLIEKRILNELNICVVSALNISEAKRKYPYSIVKQIVSKPLNRTELQKLKLT